MKHERAVRPEYTTDLGEIGTNDSETVEVLKDVCGEDRVNGAGRQRESRPAYLAKVDVRGHEATRAAKHLGSNIYAYDAIEVEGERVRYPTQAAPDLQTCATQ